MASNSDSFGVGRSSCHNSRSTSSDYGGATSSNGNRSAFCDNNRSSLCNNNGPLLGNDNWSALSNNSWSVFGDKCFMNSFGNCRSMLDYRRSVFNHNGSLFNVSWSMSDSDSWTSFFDVSGSNSCNWAFGNHINSWKGDTSVTSGKVKVESKIKSVVIKDFVNSHIWSNTGPDDRNLGNNGHAGSQANGVGVGWVVVALGEK